jgi:predicted dehydrogenase
MKACFIGMGSIGQRHLRNFATLSEKFNLKPEIHAFRNTKKQLDAEISRLVDREVSSESGLRSDYDICFIANPTNSHFETFKLMENRTKNMFIEKPVFNNNKYSINDLNLNPQGYYYVAGPLKFSDVVMKIKEIIKNEKVYSIRAISSSYLPDWREGKDYRKTYSSKKEQGGGVSLDLIHEWDYITHMFGFPEEVFNIKGGYSHLEIDSEDISVYIGRYKDKLAEVHLDYFGRNSIRELELFTEKATITGDFINNKINFSDNRETLKFSSDNNEIYLREMENFIQKTVFNPESGRESMEHAYKVLQLAIGEG